MQLWTMSNGYALCPQSGLAAIAPWLEAASAEEIDALRGRLAVGLHRDVEVTEPGAAGRRVHQVFASAMPVGYAPAPSELWRPLATLVLEAAYEATLRAALLTGAKVVALTLLGGGVFHNDMGWIFAAIRRALAVVGGDLDVRIVSFGEPSAGLLELAREASGR